MKKDNSNEYYKQNGNETGIKRQLSLISYGVKRKLSFTSFAIFFFFRRILLGLTIVYQIYLFLQVYSMSIQFTIMILFLGYKPLAERNKFEFFNEITIMLVTYHLLCFSEAAYDKNFQKNLGYSLIVTEVLLIVASLLLICR